MVKILRPNETPQEELQRDFTEELRTMMKKAAKQMGCPVEMLKYRVTNAGFVEISRMDSQEAEDLRREEKLRKMQRDIRKPRGQYYV